MEAIYYRYRRDGARGHFAGTMGVMQWNFDDSRSGRLRYGAVADVLLFFISVVLVIAVAVLPTSSFTSGAVPGQDTFWSSFVMTGPIALLFCAAYLRATRRPKRSMDYIPRPEDLTISYRLVNGLVVLSIGGWALYGALNAWLDGAEGWEVYAQVQDKTVIEDGRFEDYTLVLDDWSGRSAPVILSVDSSFYDNVDAQKTCLHLVIKPGAFGHEWIAETDYYPRASNEGEGAQSASCKAEWQARSAKLNGNLYEMTRR